MTVSIAIVTYKRPRDLSQTLDSIIGQQCLPLEIIIVDNGLDIETENLIKERRHEFSNRGVELRYVANEHNSLTIGRNLAVKMAEGQIILFLDDDVILDANYIVEILRVYEQRPNALGVQGYIEQAPRSWLSNRARALFFWHHWEYNKQRVLKSVSATYPKDLNCVINCECLSGANHSFRKEVYEEFLYDERLVKYSEGEDLEISYRVFCKSRNSLYMTPNARLVHKASMQSRAIGKELITMQEVYALYLFFKLFDANIKDRIVYFWSRLGRIVLALYHGVVNGKLASFKEIKYLMAAYCLCVCDYRRIKKGNLDSFNKKYS